MVRLFVSFHEKNKAMELLGKLLDRPYEGLVKQDLLQITVAAADLCQDIGFKRKAGFYYRQATTLSVELKDFIQARSLIKKASKSYQIQTKPPVYEKTVNKQFNRYD